VYTQLQDLRQKRFTLAAGAGFFVLFFLAPVWINAERRSAAQQTVASERNALVDRQIERMSEEAKAWRLDIELAQAHGALGDEPPTLGVEDYGGEIRLTNIAGEKLNCIEMRRAPVDRPPALASNCKKPLLVGGCASLNPQESRTLPVPSGEQGCEYQPFAYRIGGFAFDAVLAGPSWWSDSELEWFDRDHSRWSLQSMPEALQGVPTKRAIEWRRKNDLWASKKSQHLAGRRQSLEKERGALTIELREINTVERQLAALTPTENEVETVRILPSQLSLGRRDGRHTISNIGRRPIKLSVYRRLHPYSGDKRRNCELGLMNTGIEARSVATLAPGQVNELAGRSNCTVTEDLQLGVEVANSNGEVVWITEWLRESRLTEARERKSEIEHRLAMIASALNASG
jgi:hypothetical protein